MRSEILTIDCDYTCSEEGPDYCQLIHQLLSQSKNGGGDNPEKSSTSDANWDFDKWKLFCEETKKKSVSHHCKKRRRLMNQIKSETIAKTNRGEFI
jgi:hypothetical protein